MKLTLAIYCFVIAVTFGFRTELANAGEIPVEQRACSTNSDCSVVSTQCCPCGDDAANFLAVSKTYQARNKHECTPQEIDRCAVAGACAQHYLPTPVCRNSFCEIEMRPLNF